MWSSIFGRENLLINVYDKNDWHNGSLIQDFMDKTGINELNFSEDVNYNPSLDRYQLEFLRRLNINGGSVGLHLKRRIIQLLEKTSTSDKLSLDNKQFEELNKTYMTGNTSILKEYFPSTRNELFPANRLSLIHI